MTYMYYMYIIKGKYQKPANNKYPHTSIVDVIFKTVLTGNFVTQWRTSLPLRGSESITSSLKTNWSQAMRYSLSTWIKIMTLNKTCFTMHNLYLSIVCSIWKLSNNLPALHCTCTCTTNYFFYFFFIIQCMNVNPFLSRHTRQNINLLQWNNQDDLNHTSYSVNIYIYNIASRATQSNSVMCACSKSRWCTLGLMAWANRFARNFFFARAAIVSVGKNIQIFRDNNG